MGCISKPSPSPPCDPSHPLHWILQKYWLLLLGCHVAIVNSSWSVSCPQHEWGRESPLGKVAKRMVTLVCQLPFSCIHIFACQWSHMMNCLSYNIDPKKNIKYWLVQELGQIHKSIIYAHHPCHEKSLQSCPSWNNSPSAPTLTCLSRHSPNCKQLNICLKVHMPSEKTKKVEEGKEEVHTLERR